MQTGLTPQHPLENDCFVGDAVEDAEETDSASDSSYSIYARYTN